MLFHYFTIFRYFIIFKLLIIFIAFMCVFLIVFFDSYVFNIISINLYVFVGSLFVVGHTF